MRFIIVVIMLLIATTASRPTHASDCEPLLFGAALSLTGKYATNGALAKKAYDFAARTINQDGGIRWPEKCWRIELRYYDDESRGDRGATIAERLITQDKVSFMLGPYSSALTAAIAPVTEKHRIPMVEALGASRSLFNKGRKYMFGVVSTSEHSLSPAVDLAAELAQSLGKSASDVRVAIAVENDPYSLDVRAGIVEAAAKFGMNIVVDEHLPRELADMSGILTKVKLLKPDLLMVSGHSKGATTAVRQIAEQGISVPMIALTQCESAGVVAKFGVAAEQIVCAAQWSETLSYHDPLFGTAPEFAKKFKQAYPEFQHRDLPYQIAAAVAAVLVYRDALERAGTLNRQVVRDALAATDIMTFYGPVKFSDRGNIIGKPIVLRQIQNGAYHVVAPVDLAQRALIWPRQQ